MPTLWSIYTPTQRTVPSRFYFLNTPFFMGPDLKKVMVTRVKIYPPQRVTAGHPANYYNDCKG